METNRAWIAPLVAGIVVAAGCEPPAQQEAAAVDSAAAVAGVDSLRSAYQQAVEEGDWQRLGTMVTEDALIVNPGSAAWDSALSAASAAGAPFPPGATLDITPRETRVLGADWAYEIGRGAVTWTPEGADRARTIHDTYLVVLHRTGEGWKVHREVASTRPLPEGGR